MSEVTNVEIFKTLFGKSVKFAYEFDFDKLSYCATFRVGDTTIPIETIPLSEMMKRRVSLLPDEVVEKINRLDVTYEIGSEIVNGTYIPVLIRFETLNREFKSFVDILDLAEFTRLLERDSELLELVTIDYNLLLFLKSLRTLKENLAWENFAVALIDLPSFIKANLKGIVREFNTRENANVVVEETSTLHILVNRRKGNSKKEYSNWLDSVWYVFWDSSSGKMKDEQKLAIWHKNDKSYLEFDYQTLKDVSEVDDLKRLLNLDIDEYFYWELYSFICEWVKDVEKEFSADQEQQ